jgi:type I restriction enzyme S subunit
MDDWGNIEFCDPPRLALNANELERLRLDDGDLIVTRTGATIGKCAIYEDRLGPALPSAYLIRFRLHKDQAVPRFILLFLLSPLGQAALWQAATATAQPNVNAKSIALIPLALPPLEEQWEIVRRATKLLSTVDPLLARIDDGSRAIKRTSQAILVKAFRGELLVEETAVSA